MMKFWDYGYLILESWKIFRVLITNSTSNGILSFQMARSSALNEEVRRKTHGYSCHLIRLSQKLGGEVGERNRKRW